MLPKVADLVKFDDKIIGFVNKIENVYNDPYHPFSLVFICIYSNNNLPLSCGIHIYSLYYIPSYLSIVSV